MDLVKNSTSIPEFLSFYSFVLFVLKRVSFQTPVWREVAPAFSVKFASLGFMLLQHFCFLSFFFFPSNAGALPPPLSLDF